MHLEATLDLAETNGLPFSTYLGHEHRWLVDNFLDKIIMSDPTATLVGTIAQLHRVRSPSDDFDHYMEYSKRSSYIFLWPIFAADKADIIEHSQKIEEWQLAFDAMRRFVWDDL